MYRRRRPQREKIVFSFDSFLDVVANVTGIIIRLILVAWVGGRGYDSAMRLLKDEPPPTVAPLPAPKAEDLPVSAEIAQAEKDLVEMQRRLLEQMRQLDLEKDVVKSLEAKLTQAARERGALDEEKKGLDGKLTQRTLQTRLASMSLDELRQRSQKLANDLKDLEKQAPAKQVLRFRTPVSKVVRADEVFFECQAGRVAYIDLQACLQEVRVRLDDHGEELKARGRVSATTGQYGAFKLRYTIEKDTVGVLDSPLTGIRFGLSEWVVEPAALQRGETLEQALQPGSSFRQLVESLDPQVSVVTFWVYEDSFPHFRQLRDYLYERGLEVAGRPLPQGAPIAASRHGTRSRGQ